MCGGWLYADTDETREEVVAAVTGRKPKKLTKADLTRALDGQSARLMHLDLVGTAEAALEILKVERARIGKWRRKGILLSNGERIDFPEPILMVTTAATEKECLSCGTRYENTTTSKVCPNCGAPGVNEGKDYREVKDFTKLAATPLWWTDDIRALARTLARNKPRD